MHSGETHLREVLMGVTDFSSTQSRPTATKDTVHGGSHYNGRTVHSSPEYYATRRLSHTRYFIARRLDTLPG